jgi:hypothetical protein
MKEIQEYKHKQRLSSPEKKTKKMSQKGVKSMVKLQDNPT